MIKILWTQHSGLKIRQYGLSKSKLLAILRKPDRKEEGIALGTTAVMQTNKKFSNKNISFLSKEQKKFQKASGEVWLMYKDTKLERKIISAWRYPGISKPGETIPIPEDIIKALQTDNELK